MKKALSILLLFFVHPFSAGAGYEMTIEGKLMSYPSELASLKQDSGLIVKVPTSSLKGTEGLITGVARVSASLSSAEFMKLNPKALK